MHRCSADNPVKRQTGYWRKDRENEQTSNFQFLEEPRRNFSHFLKEGSEFELEREMVAVDSIPWKHGYGMHEIPQLLYIVAQQIDMYSNPMNAGNEKGLTS